MNDREKIQAEMGDHGDTRTTSPRLVCSDCNSFVYLTWPRMFKQGATRAECACSWGDPKRGEIPDTWVRINEYAEVVEQ